MYIPYFCTSIYTEILKYIFSIYTDYASYTYFTTTTQVISRKCIKSIAPYISSY